jgi:uncharacterized iron-regulated membrane protein
MMTLKRLLFLFHRWAGIVLCALFALWFVSGVVMMYVGFPELTEPQRRAGLPALDFSTARLSPAAAIAHFNAGDFRTVGTPSGNHDLPGAAAGAPLRIGTVQLGMLLGRPVYYVHARGAAQPRAVFADTGELLPRASPAMARAVAVDFARRAGWTDSAAKVAYRGTLQTDQWTVSSALNAYRPLYRFELNDARGTDVYVSSTTAEVVRDTRRRQRVLNYFGSVTHWIYPTMLRRRVDLWTWVIDIVSGAGTLLAISGLWVGILRWRWTRPPGVSAIPYRGWMRWHFITGAVFGLLTLTWVFSGLLSMNPGRINPPRSPTAAETAVFAGGRPALQDAQIPRITAADQAVQAQLLQYDAQPFYRITYRDGTKRLVPAASYAEHGPTTAALLASVPKLMPGMPVADLDVLGAYDNYYYTRQPEDGGRPLPVIRAKFSDPAHTWFYIDAATGQILERSTRFNRVYRWLYNGLHSWDFRWLWMHRPLWDIVLIAFSAGGVLLSVLGVIVGIRRLRFDLGYMDRRRYGERSEGAMDSVGVVNAGGAGLIE